MELERVKRAGRRLRTEHLDVRAIDSLLSHARVAVIVAKHGHSIVERNRLRRRLRELARTRIIPVTDGVDLVIRSLASAYDASFEQLSMEVETVVTKLGAMSS
jgi:ribonuclease P protein component